MFKNDTQSIQQLLTAEKRAEERVNQARKRKLLRLKQAKEDAQAEIKEFRDEKEQEFKEHESKFLGNRDAVELKIERDTENSLTDMQKFVKMNIEGVVEYLLGQVLSIKCEIHANYRHDDLQFL